MEIANLGELITQNKEVFFNELNDVINPTFKGMINPMGYDSMIDLLIEKLNRPLFPRQARLVSAAVEHLEGAKSLLVSSEMGTGKTAMALGIALEERYKVNFIMCPPHLVSKWADEIRMMYRGVDYKIVIVTRWSDLTPYTKRNLKKEGCKYFFIVSRETSKLSYPKQEVFVRRFKYIEKEEILDGNPLVVKRKVAIACCPRCGSVIKEGLSEHSVFETTPYKCGNVFKDKEDNEIGTCGEVLRQVDKTASPNLQTRLSVAEYVKRQWKKGSIDLLIADEVHEYKGGATGQGNAFAQMASVSKKIVGLTGTLLNGYASSLFYILWRLNPSLMKNTLNLDYNQVKQFVQIYGAHEETVEVLESTIEGVVTKMGKVVAVKEKPKISPFLLSLLLDFTIFLRLDEIKMENLALPDYDESIDLVDMDEEWQYRYTGYIAEIASRIRKDKRFLGNLANDAIAVPDMPYSWHEAQGEIFHSPRVVRSASEIPALLESIKKISVVDCDPADIKVLPFTAKELRLIELVKEELKQGRNCLVYIHFSNKGVGDTITRILTEALGGYKVNQLKATVDAKKRQAWIKANPCDVLVCNPELVKTGLDLLEFPTIIFYETTYNVFTLKQASRRSWRIGQTEAVKVIFMAYRDSAQHKALELIGAKVAAANSLEGRLSGEDDLSSMGDDEDNIQLALAKAILNGESAAKEIKMSSVKRFGEREWDAFEAYYRDRVASFVPKAKTAPAVEAKEQEAEPFVFIADAKKPSASTATTAIALDLFGSSSDEEATDDDFDVFNAPKIVIYKRIKKGNRTVEQRMEVSRDEIDAMVGSNDSEPMQLSLF